MFVEIEVDTPNNAELMFEPIQERVRGRFLPARVRQESAGKLAMSLPDGLPGCRIRLDTDSGTGTILEPLSLPQHAATRATCAKQMTGDESATEARLSFAPAERTFTGVHTPTWLAWMVKAVRGGLARVVVGKLPADPPADAKPRVFSSMSQGVQKDAKDVVIDRLTKLLMAKLTPAERKELGL